MVRVVNRALLALACAWLWTGAVSAEPIDPPLALRLEFADDSRRSVRVTSADAAGFGYVTSDGDEVSASWTDLKPASLASSFPRLRDGESVQTWLELGGLLSTMKGAARQERIAFQRARQIDPGVATPDAIEAAKARAAAGPEGDATGEAMRDEHTHGEGFNAPRLTAVDRAWPKLTEQEQAEATQELRDFAEPIVSRIAPRTWKQAETDYFLLYTDLDMDEARYWGRLLDRMYDRMRVVFRVPEGENIFKGRCLITIWSTEQRFAEWLRLAEGFHIPPGSGIAGLCSGYPDGQARVTFYRQPDRAGFALVLVHEASHAFTHRYRTGRHIPSWVNEGLAELVAHYLVDAPQWAAGRARGSRQGYQANGGLGSLFVNQPIDGYQYGQAWEFTQMMVDANVDGYRAFFDALKDGEDIHTAFEDHYGAPLDRLVRAYHQAYSRSGLMDYIEP